MLNSPAMYAAVVARIDHIAAGDWNALSSGGNPFLRHEFLHGLETTGCVAAATGWEPCHLALYADSAQTRLLAAAPLFCKHHSYGEYVFDWAWADAYRRAGLSYYPKLVSAVPFTPVTGNRLLLHPQTEADLLYPALLQVAMDQAANAGASSLHWLFTTPDESRAIQAQGFMTRIGNQFHWHNAGYDSFEHYLSRLTAKRRKQIRRERRRVSDAGIVLDIVAGTALEPGHWDAMYRFYRSTVANHGAIAYLNREFFDYLAENFAEHVVLVLARDGGRTVAGSLNFVGGGTMYGRYWGADGYYDGLHFEACYYRPIEYCIHQGMAAFEAGAQGEHKLSRGLLPQATYSQHWLRDTDFANAVADFLLRESSRMDLYARSLAEHSPFRREV